MNINRQYEVKTRLEKKISDIDDCVMVRWKNLLGQNCGYFEDWSLKKNMVSVSFRYRDGDPGSDDIPIECFEIEDTNEAIKHYKNYKAELKVAEEKQGEVASKEQRRKQYEALKKEFGE